MEAPMLEVKPATAVAGESGPTNAEASFRGADLYALLLLAALVFIAIFPWHAVNQRLPIWDSADFVLTSQKIADAFNTGLITGIKALYLERGWRPIIFPTLAAPFFLLTGSQIRLSVGLTQFASSLMLVVYVYSFLRQEYSSRRALAGAVLILGMPWLVNFSQLFFAEMFCLAATAAIIHHVSIALRRSSRLHYILAGVWLGLMGAARPIETAIVALVPVATLLAYAVRQKIVTVADVAAFVVQLVLVAVAVGLSTQPIRHGYVILPLVLASLLVIVLRARRLWTDSPLLASLICAELIALTWHLPTIRPLYLWVQETSFGIWAQVTDQRFKDVSPLVIFSQQIQYFSSELLLTLVVLAAPSAIGMFRRGSTGVHSRALALLVTAALMIVPMLVLYSLTGTSDVRRLMPGVLVLYLGIVTFALAPHGLLHQIRPVCVLAIAVALFTVAAGNGLGVKSNGLLRVQSVFGYLRQPYVGQDPNGPVLESLLRMGISHGNISAYTRCYRAYEECERNSLPSFEPMALSTLARERDIPLYVHYVTDLDFSKPETLSRQILIRDFQYLLVDMAELKQPTNEADPYARHTEEFISMERSNLPRGLIQRGCFSTLNRPMCVVEVDQHTN
jgi:hypothetical protein